METGSSRNIGIADIGMSKVARDMAATAAATTAPSALELDTDDDLVDDVEDVEEEFIVLMSLM